MRLIRLIFSLRTVLWLSLAAGLIGLGGFGGLWLANALDRPSSLPHRALIRAESYYNATFRSGAAGDPVILDTNRLALAMQTVNMPASIPIYSGGISAFRGDTVLVIDSSGGMFHVADGQVEELSVAAPENNLDALRQQSEDNAFGRATVDLKWHRYNDILHVEDSGKEWLLVSFNEWHPQEFCVSLTLARVEIDPASTPSDWSFATGDWDIVTRTDPCLEPMTFGKALRGHEAGGRIAHVAGTTVVWSSGSFERDDFATAPDFAEAYALSFDNDYGKVMEVDFLSGDKTILAGGLSNPQGLTVDRDGEIWVTDHGPRGGDELNLVKPGANFGWPAVTYGTGYDKAPPGGADLHGNHEGYDRPMIAFVPSVAPGSAIAVDNFHYSWDGDILVGAYRGALHRVHVEDGRAMFVEPIEIGVRARDMAMLSDGRFVVWSDFRQLLYFSTDDTPDPVSMIKQTIADLEDDVLRLEVADTADTCLQCHSLSEGDHGAGPSLYGICGQRPGQVDGYADYSGALSAVSTPWSPDQIAAFVTDPWEFAPETSMGWGGMDNPEAAALIGELFCR